ncbi:Fip1 motif-domain-containing protein [Bisporella sp. PMI_857]|nr:Fip1 motif-domain-containing protein [Bisporella sp. PMI_857]
MDVDDEDDFYGADESAQSTSEQAPKQEAKAEPTAKSIKEDDDLEEGEEEDEEDSDSDIDIITEKKDGDAPAPSIYNKAPPLRNAPAVKKEDTKKDNAAKDSSSAIPAGSTSKIDIDAKPIYEPAGKPITQINIDEDLPDNDKPWRRPGADVSDYFNYGFDEFTWALYASKQETIKAEGQSNKKAFEDMSMMFGMGGMPGLPGMPAMPGAADGIPPEMQEMMAQMMASGMDPSQMNPAMFGGAGATAGAQNAGQGFGGQGGFGQGQDAYGYNQGTETRNRGGNFGRGRGGRRNW